MTSFAAYIPVGPSSLDLERVVDLLDSVYAYEPGVRLIVLIDHGPAARDFGRIIGRYSPSLVHAIRHSSQSHHGTWKGAGCVTNLVAIDHILSSLEVDFVIKLDTDALVISAFSEKLDNVFSRNPNIGIAGTLGNSCNREMRTYKFNAVAKHLFQEAFNVADRLRVAREGLDNTDIVRWNLFENEQRIDFTAVCAELRSILPNFDGEHCQGGSYAVSKIFMSRMKSKGRLSNPKRWLYIPIDEDKMMGAYCVSLGLLLADFSGQNQPFGVQAVGLPYTLEKLVERNYSIIHSLRNDNDLSETRIRECFQERRRLKHL